jgi:hypothetical protein
MKKFDMEAIPDSVSEKDVIDESHKRSAKAGYTTRYGEPTYRTKIQTTCGFGSEKLNVWPRDKQGNLLP